nr:MAG TPA: hypothetical protein [Caudoviricetes sp.]
MASLYATFFFQFFFSIADSSLRCQCSIRILISTDTPFHAENAVMAKLIAINKQINSPHYFHRSKRKATI